MRILFIGGTGNISGAITRLLAERGDCELFLLNRGNHMSEVPEGVNVIRADINDENDVAHKLEGLDFDSVCDFIGFRPEQVERDFRLFNGRTRQFIYISSTSAYNKPAPAYVLTEGTSLANPHWEYSRLKIACEEALMRHYREDGFPVTIVRPSHTYGKLKIPVSVHGPKGAWQVVKRMLNGKPVIVHGDGESLWTLTFNEDFARGFVGLICNPHAIGEAFHITSDETLSWNQIYRTIADTLGVEFRPYYVSSSLLASLAPDHFGMEGNLLGDKAASAVFDCSKLRRAVPSFRPVVPFRDGCRKALDHFISHPELQLEDPEFDKWCDDVIELLEKARKDFQTKSQDR